jgi:hypothetical protein
MVDSAIVADVPEFFQGLVGTFTNGCHKSRVEQNLSRIGLSAIGRNP